MVALGILLSDREAVPEAGAPGLEFRAKGNGKGADALEREMVELSGIEPLASSLRTRRSPS